MKTLKLASAVLLMLGVFLSLGVVAVLADGPAGTNPMNASYLDNQAHTIPAGASVWYRFDYGSGNPDNLSDRPVTTLALKNGNRSGVSFELWSADTINDMADNHPIGRGTSYAVDCDTGNISGSGGCQSDDLTWSGKFGGVGTYYVCVDNNNPFATSALLTIQGAGVRLTPIAATAPSARAQPVATTDDPTQATIIDGQLHNVAAGSAIWYRFNYAIDTDTGTRPTKTITLMNGTNSGVRFEVWTADAMNGGWWNNNPIGRGTPYAVDCNSGVRIGGGGCQSDDLTWSGAFGTSNTYYVRIVNDNTVVTNFILTIQ